MKLVCPGCGTQGSIELFASDAPARQVAALMGRVPAELSGLVLSYLGLFRPASRALTWPRVHTLLEELVPANEAGEVRRGRQEFRVTPVIWKAALDQVTQQRDKLDLPLKTHGYLFEILRAQSQRQAKGELEAERIQATPIAERNREAVARSNLEAEKQGIARLGLAPLTPEQEAAFLAKEMKR